MTEKLKQAEIKLHEVTSKITQLTKLNFNLKEDKSKIRKSDPKISDELNQLENKKQRVRESMIELNAETKNIDTQINHMLVPEQEKINEIMKQQEKETGLFQNEITGLKEYLDVRSKELKVKQKEETQYHGKFKDLIHKRNKTQDKVQTKEKSMILEQEKVRNLEHRNNNVSIDKAKIVATVEGLEKEGEMYKEGTIKRGLSVEEITLKVKQLEREFNRIGNVNLRALEVYEEIKVEHEKLVTKVTSLKSEKDDVLMMMQEIESKKKYNFMKTFTAIKKNFSTIFSQLSNKGSAHMDLENEENIFEGGIDLKVRISGNKFLDLKSLSGGEKTMAALALIFAIQEYEPSPFYLLDEVDAALDKKNSQTLSNLIQQYSKKAQYIVISHNDTVINEADQIYGVSMKEGVSKVISLKI